MPVPLPSMEHQIYLYSYDTRLMIRDGLGRLNDALILNAAGRFAVRAAIRTEQRERRERWVWWIPIVFGLIGALTGLVSVFKVAH